MDEVIKKAVNQCIYSLLDFDVFPESGAGGSRTRVQTRKPQAFYMLIPRLVFRINTGSGPPIFTLSLLFSQKRQSLA